MTRPSSHRHAFGAARLVWFAAIATLSGCPNAPTQEAPEGFTVTLGQLPAMIRGTSVQVPVTIERMEGFDGAVAIEVTDISDPTNGVTGGRTTIPSGQTSASVTVTIPSGAPVGDAELHVDATSDGFLDESDFQYYTIRVAGTFDLGIADGPGFTFPGTTLHETVQVIRAQYTQSVTVTAGTVPPFTTTVTPSTPTDNSINNLIAVDIVVPASVVPGSYSIPLTATGAGGQHVTMDLPFSVHQPSYTLSAAPPATAIAAGSTGQITVTATRDPGFTGSISLTGTGAGGLTVAPATLAANQTTMTVTVPASVTTGSYAVLVTGTASGLTNQTTSVDVAVTGVSLSLSVVNAPLNVTAGTTSQPDVVNLVRTNFTGAVTVTATADDPNITVSVNPATATTANSVNLTVTVAPSGTGTNGGPPVTAGTHIVTLTGASSLPNVTTTFAVVVALPAGGAPVSLAMTPSGTTPIHLASGATQKFTSWLVDAAGNRTTPAAGTSFGIFADVSSVLGMPAATFDATQQLLTATGTAGANGNTAVRALYLNSSNGQTILPLVLAVVIVP